MAHFAKLDSNNAVICVVVGRDEDNETELSSRTGDTYRQTSYNTHSGQHPNGQPFRKNFAGIGYTYDAGRDAFIPPKPFASWNLNESTCQWEAPVARPNDENRYDWNESGQQWVVNNA